MKSDPELNDWRAQWMAQVVATGKSPAELRAAAVKQQRRLRTGHVLELVAALVFFLLGAVVAWRNRTLEAWLWAGIVWASTAVATAFSVWNWHILWKANALPVADYALDYRKRCMASLRAVRFGTGSLVVQIAIAVPWLTWNYLRHRLSGVVFTASIALVACLALGFRLLFSRYRRMAQRELEELGASQIIPEG